jgi:hypothetical protein
MAMQERLTVTLDHKQIKEACESFLSPRIAMDEVATAQVDPAWHIVVTISKKRVRKAKGAA